MKSKLKMVLVAIVSCAIGIWFGSLDDPSGEIRYELVEDNQVETIIGLYRGDNTTLIALNRFEGKMYVTISDGQSVPETWEVK